MKLTRIDYSGGYLWVIDKRVRPSTKDFTFWSGLLFYPLSAIYDDSLKVVAQSPNLSIPNVPYVEFEEDVEILGLKEYPCNPFWIGSGDSARLYDEWAAQRNAFILGYKAAQSKGIYSEDDLRKALELQKESAYIYTSKEHYTMDSVEHSKSIDDIIASLNQPPLEIEIETEDIMEHNPKFTTPDWIDIVPVTYMRDGKTYLKVKQ